MKEKCINHTDAAIAQQSVTMKIKLDIDVPFMYMILVIIVGVSSKEF